MKKKALVGFDGFIDQLLEVVAIRSGIDYSEMQTISELAEYIAQASGKSCNLELVEKTVKIGGNGANLAYALGLLNCNVDFIGTVGNKEIDPVFFPLKTACQTVETIGSAGKTEALEFTDGKVMLGQYPALHSIEWLHIEEKKFIKKAEQADLIATVNWTMLHCMNEIWENLLQKAPFFCAKKRWLFIDLADPKKRKIEDQVKAFSIIKKLKKYFYTILSANTSEAEQILSLVTPYSFSLKEEIAKKAQLLQQTLHLTAAVIHTRKECVVTDQHTCSLQTVELNPNPLITTGAGDNFNAGFCKGLLLDYPLDLCLKLACQTAKNYVTTGQPC